MTLLTKKIADKIAGIDEPGTTTSDIDEIDYLIGKKNPSDNSNQIHNVEDIGNEIVKNLLASKAY